MPLHFTVIQHGFRRENNLSCVEYVLCDMVYFLSNSDASPVPGWCFMSKEQIATELNLSKQAILNMIDRMVEAGFLYKNDQTKYLKTSSKWQQVYFTDGKETLLSNGQLSLLGGGKETLPNNNSSYNNSNKEDPKRIFLKSVVDWIKTNPNKYPTLMYVEFCEYWIEKSATGKKMRFQGEKFFDLGRRLSTWHKNSEKSLLNFGKRKRAFQL
jgi:hypothetical protein